MTWTVKQELCVYDDRGFTVATADNVEAAARIVALSALLPIVRWIAENDGECIGDHPHWLAELDVALATIDWTR